jgi:bifunctional non-homologous end joining protein LigD
MAAPIKPMLATPAATLPAGPDWTYEFKWDGVRALVEVAAGAVHVTTRLGGDATVAYPELATLGEGIDDALLDGEVVAFADGRPSFGLLQTRMHVRAARPHAERRATLERLAADHPQLTVSPSFDDGAATEAAAREHLLEGVVAKRRSSHYRAGQRAPDWVKVKFVRRGEFVVVGWEADADSPAALSSLLLGYYDTDELRFAGKVGSGLSGRESRSLHETLTERADCPLRTVPVPSPGRVVTWVEPEVVVEVSYSHWADDGRLRHPVFLGVRVDKNAREVARDA